MSSESCGVVWSSTGIANQVNKDRELASVNNILVVGIPLS